MQTKLGNDNFSKSSHAFIKSSCKHKIFSQSVFFILHIEQHYVTERKKNSLSEYNIYFICCRIFILFYLRLINIRQTLRNMKYV